MKLKILPHTFTVCRLGDIRQAPLDKPFCFLSRTDEEISLVCPTEYAPAETEQREDGWRAFRIEGTLDFSLIGILAKISTCLAENGIAIFACSTYNTDYVLLKEEMLSKAVLALGMNGYEICNSCGADPNRSKSLDITRRI